MYVKTHRTQTLEPDLPPPPPSPTTSPPPDVVGPGQVHPNRPTSGGDQMQPNSGGATAPWANDMGGGMWCGAGTRFDFPSPRLNWEEPPPPN